MHQNENSRPNENEEAENGNTYDGSYYDGCCICGYDCVPTLLKSNYYTCIN